MKDVISSPTLCSPTKDPTVSVIMNCFNGEKYLREAIDSVYAQTYTDWEIVFWDNASADNSAEIAKSYDNKLKYFRGEKTISLYAARSYAVDKARGKYIAILDCDDLWLPTKLEEQIPLFERDEKVGLVYSDSLLFNRKGKRKRLFEFKKPQKGNVFSKLLFDGFIYTPTVVIRKKTFEDLNISFDKRFKMMGDYDVYLRISHKWKVDYVDKPLARYRVHSNSTTCKDGRNLIASELDLMIENLKKIVNNFESKYSKENKFLIRRRDIQISLLEWENGNRKMARERLYAYIHDRMAFRILYILMFLPYKYVFYPCYRMYTKNIMPV